jgi:hypothetical protein
MLKRRVKRITEIPRLILGRGRRCKPHSPFKHDSLFMEKKKIKLSITFIKKKALPILKKHAVIPDSAINELPFLDHLLGALGNQRVMLIF